MEPRPAMWSGPRYFPLSLCSVACGWCVQSMPELRTIDAEDDGARIDRWFKRHYPAVTHGLLEKLLRKGEIRLDGSRIKAADRVVAGQVLKLPPQVIHAKSEAPEKPKPEQQKPMGSLADRILYMDKH